MTAIHLATPDLRAACGATAAPDLFVTDTPARITCPACLRALQRQHHLPTR